MIDVDEAGFETDVLQRSTEVPVVIDFWAEWCEPCKQLGPLLERLAAEYNGRFVLAKVDVDANQMLMQQFGIQGIPAVFAVVAGQALPLFQGAAPESQIRQTLDQLIQVGEERFGLTGIVVDEGAGSEGEESAPAEVPAGPYDAQLEAAAQALDENDFDGAVQAYRVSSRTIRPTPRRSWASRRPNCWAGSRAWTRSRSARRPRRIRPRRRAAGRRRSGPRGRPRGGRLRPARRDGPP